MGGTHMSPTTYGICLEYIPIHASKYMNDHHLMNWYDLEVWPSAFRLFYFSACARKATAKHQQPSPPSHFIWPKNRKLQATNLTGAGSRCKLSFVWMEGYGMICMICIIYIYIHMCVCVICGIYMWIWVCICIYTYIWLLYMQIETHQTWG